MKRDIGLTMKAAFPYTIPVLAGFLFSGMAYGILMSENGFSWPWVLLASVLIFAGSLQFVGISLLCSAFNPLYALMMALAVNARHLFYGVSMLQKYRGAGPLKPYLIFALCDETFSLLCSAEPPPGIRPHLFMFVITALHQGYWLAGCLAGALIGPLIPFNTQGIDFAMTAFFTVIFLNQWRAQKDHAPALIGISAATLCLLAFGANNFVMPAMALIVAALLLIKKPSLFVKSDARL